MYSNTLYYSDFQLGALLKQEVIANKNLLTWGFELATRWQAMIIGSFHKLRKHKGVGRLSAKGLFLFTKSGQIMPKACLHNL